MERSGAIGGSRDGTRGDSATDVSVNILWYGGFFHQHYFGEGGSLYQFVTYKTLFAVAISS